MRQVVFLALLASLFILAAGETPAPPASELRDVSSPAAHDAPPAPAAPSPAQTHEDDARGPGPPEEALPTVQAPPVPADIDEAELGTVLAELRALRVRVDALQEALDLYVGGLLTELQQENARLREEVRDLYRLRTRPPASVAPHGAAPPPGPPEPPPLSEAAVAALRDEADAALIEALDADMAAHGPYEVLAEWGRSPEEAEALGDILSLKGMVCVVPKGRTRERLLALARGWHADFAPYDNVNITVFDDRAAAERFVQQNIDPFNDRVMEVSKHQRSGRDAVVVFEDGIPVVVPWSG